MEGRLYFLRHYQGRLTCLTAVTGQPIYTATKLADIESVYASLTGAAGRVYVVCVLSVTAREPAGLRPDPASPARAPRVVFGKCA